VKTAEGLHPSLLLDTASKDAILHQSGNTKVLVCSAICTHLGCVPIPYLGAYGGWVKKDFFN